LLLYHTEKHEQNQVELIFQGNYLRNFFPYVSKHRFSETPSLGVLAAGMVGGDQPGHPVTQAVCRAMRKIKTQPCSRPPAIDAQGLVESDASQGGLR
jgi:hypothetical protein